MSIFRIGIINFLVLCVGLMMGTQAFANDCEKLYDQKDYVSAFPLCLALARGGDRGAQFNTAWMYSSANGTSKNDKKAVFWYAKAAKQGSPDAMNNLGSKYRKGEGVEQDYSKALFWFRKASLKGNAYGSKNCGYMYIKGLGVRQEEADATANFCIGYVYDEGFLDVWENNNEAEKWYQKAANMGDVTAMNNLGFLYEEKKEYLKAAKWYQKAVDLGDAAAMNSLGIMYAWGQGVAYDRRKSFSLFQASAKNGHAYGADNLAHYYRYSFGYDGEDFLAQARTWYKKAAELGVSEAKNEIREMDNEKNSALLFGENLAHVKRESMQRALKKKGVVALRENGGYWYDKYDPSSALDGASSLVIGYVSDSGRLAVVDYTFLPSKGVEKVSNMLRSKYGAPDSVDGTLAVGEMTYKWKKGAIDIKVTRSWPSGTVHLIFSHEPLRLEMKDEIKFNDQQKKQKKFKAQSDAF